MYSFIKNIKKLIESSHVDDELNERCKKCRYNECKIKHFQRNFKNWTSGNKYIDKFIQDTQLSEHDEYSVSNAIEWIPYDRFYNIKYIEKGGFGKVYRANWIDGNINYWSNKKQNWRRVDQNKFVVL